jgi:hypothetical protein
MGFREPRTGQQRVLTFAASTTVGGKVGLRSKQPPLAVPTARAIEPIRVQMVSQAGPAEAVVQLHSDREVNHAATI